MYVDKTLSGIKAVQTLSRLNRAHPRSTTHSCSTSRTTPTRFKPRSPTTTARRFSAEETDPNKLHDLKAKLDAAQVYDDAKVEEFVRSVLGLRRREQLDPILDGCVDDYTQHLDEDGQVKFKGSAKAFVRTYGFLASVLPYSNPAWEKLSIFLNFLIPKLPAPKDTDFAKGILEAIDMESYRSEVQAAISIALPTPMP